MEVGEDGKYHEITTIQDEPGRGLDLELEDKIRRFLKDCFDIGVPRSQGRARKDIQVFLQTHNIPSPKFKNQRPGNY